MSGQTCRVILCILMACLIMGCSGRTGNPVGGNLESKSAVSMTGHQCWGLWDIVCDPSTGTAQAIPLRSADFNANVVRFLQPPIAPINLLSVTMQSGSDFATGSLILDITLRHPFPGLSQFRGFDVRGIILSEGGNVGIHDSGISYYMPGGTHVLNPDGYTRWWNQAEFTSFGTIFGYTEGGKSTPGFSSTATLNPYKLFADGLAPDASTDTLNIDNRATFSTNPGINTRRYSVQFNMNGTPKFRFKYSVDASWSLPDPKFKPKYPLEAFDLSANCQEAYMVSVGQFEESPYWVSPTVYGGDAVFQLTLGDWQSKASPDLPMQFSHVWVESPTLLDAPVDIKDSMEFISSKHPSQATYRCIVPDCSPSGLDNQQFLITIESANPTTYQPQIDGNTGNFVWPNAPLAAYSVVDVPITDDGPVLPGDYWVIGLPDWCSLTEFCTDGADNLQLITNIVKMDLPGPNNKGTVVKWWEGHISPTPPWSTWVIQNLVQSLGYSFVRTGELEFAPDNCRVVIVVLPRSPGAIYLPFSANEIASVKKYVKDGGILCFLIENPDYFNPAAMAVIDQLGIPLGYGGYAQPPSNTTVTTDITPDYLTTDVLSYQYWTCGAWTLKSPDAVSLVRTPTGENIIVKAKMNVE